MWFVSKKKYEALLRQKEDLERIAISAVTQNSRILDGWSAVTEEMKSIQELNHQLVERNDELLLRITELGTEKEGLELRVDILNTDYDALDREHVRVCREVDTLREGKEEIEDKGEV